MTSNTDIDLIEEAIVDYWGERCTDFHPDCPTCQAWADFDRLRASTASGEAVVSLRKSGQEFLEAAEAVFDWMNGNDLSADHEEQKPDDFERVSKALVEFRAALSSDNPDTTPGGKA